MNLITTVGAPGIVLCIRPANERWHYILTMSFIAWAHTQNNSWSRLITDKIRILYSKGTIVSSFMMIFISHISDIFNMCIFPSTRYYHLKWTISIRILAAYVRLFHQKSGSFIISIGAGLALKRSQLYIQNGSCVMFQYDIFIQMSLISNTFQCTFPSTIHHHSKWARIA